jgi:hypothetical protein
MAKRPRNILKNFFKKGRLPSEENFSDLVDSTLNIVDDGLDKTVEHGLKLSAIGESRRLISFYNDIQDQKPVWSVHLDEKNKDILINNEADRTVLSVGFNNYGLSLKGVLECSGRKGIYKDNMAPADGKWHPIISGLSGCNGFEIAAGAGKKKSGKYVLMHAVALNAYNPQGWFFNLFNLKKRIKYHMSYYRFFGTRLKLRWTGNKDSYSLELKSCSNYGEKIYIKYHITQLWFDPFMKKSQL